MITVLKEYITKQENLTSLLEFYTKLYIIKKILKRSLNSELMDDIHPDGHSVYVVDFLAGSNREAFTMVCFHLGGRHHGFILKEDQLYYYVREHRLELNPNIGPAYRDIEEWFNQRLQRSEYVDLGGLFYLTA